MKHLWFLPLAVALGVACQPVPTLLQTDTTTRGPNVGVTGDSLVYQAEYGPTTESPELDHMLTDALQAVGYRPKVQAKSGASTLSLGAWGTWVNDDIAVTALGTNDAIAAYNGTTTIAAAQKRLESHLATIRADCDVLVGIVETPYRHLNVYGPAWNQVLREHADVFVDWWALARAHPEYLTADQTHHTAAGRAAYRIAITQGVQSCP